MPKAEEDIQKDKEKLLTSLKDCSGIVTFACEKVGLSRQTFYRWYRDDSEFKERADAINELQIDIAEILSSEKNTEGGHYGYHLLSENQRQEQRIYRT